jgi:hypothetical protein
MAKLQNNSCVPAFSKQPEFEADMDLATLLGSSLLETVNELHEDAVPPQNPHTFVLRHSPNSAFRQVQPKAATSTTSTTFATTFTTASP